MQTGATQWTPDAESSPLSAPDSVVRTLFEHAWDACALMDADGTVRDVSPSNSKLLGYSSDDLIGRIGFDLVHADDRPQVRETVEALRRESSGPVTFKHQFRAADGSWRRLQTTMQNELNHPAIRGLVVHSRDVTDEDGLRAQLRQAEQRLQRLQLHPHFVLNVLQSIQTQMLSDPGAAATTIADFGDLLRLSYQHLGETMSPLGDELAFVERYVDLYRERFSQDIVTTIHVPDVLRSVEVPSLLLQPLVENALRHGLQPVDGGHLRIRGRRTDGELQLTIRDDGIGLGEGTNGEGIGLSASRERLEQMYGEGAGLDIEAAPDGGTLATITLPAPAAPNEDQEQPAA